MYLYKTVYSSRRTLAIEVRRDGEIIVRSPYKVSDDVISAFVKKHEKWIENTLEKAKRQAYVYDDADVERLKEEAGRIIPPIIKFYSETMKLYPTSVKITAAKTRFGSCSTKHRICFSCFLMKYPKSVIEYVVVHELAHIKYHNHKKEFYSLIEKFLPDYKEREKILKGNA